MTHKKSAVIVLLLGFLAFSFCWWQARVNASGAADPTDTYYPSKLRFSTLFSTEDRQIFYFDYLFPLFYAQDENTLLFINPKEKLFSPWSEETNLGIGLRKIINDKFILGVHFFYDKTLSENKNWFSQVGSGFELLSEPFDFRFNYYDPITKAKNVGINGYSFGETHLLLTTNMEEPLHGFDFEIGAPLVPKALKTRVYLGGFFYDSKLGKDRNGFRARTETNLNSWLAIDTILNNHNGGEIEFIGGFRVTIPLEFGKFWRTGKSPFKVTPRESAIKERIFERVVRDIDIQSSSKSETQQDNNVEIIYVDNTNAGTANGTHSHPWPTLAEAFLDSRYIGEGGTANYIYVNKGDGTPTGYTGNYFLNSDNVVLWGSGYNGGFRGIPAPGFPIVDGDGAGVITINGNNDTVMGLQIQNGASGIDVLGASGGTIKYNTITGNAFNGINIMNNDTTMSDFTITGNTITENTGNGISVGNNYYGTMSGITISNNVVTYNGLDGIKVTNEDGTISNQDGAFSDFTISGNTVDNNGRHGIEFRNQGYYYTSATMSNIKVSNNKIRDNGEDGILFYNEGYDTDATMSDFTISGNTITGNGTYYTSSRFGLEFYNYSYNATATMSDFTVSGNTIASNVSDGAALSSFNNGFYYGAISNIDFGGGSRGSTGRNSFYDNGAFDLYNDSGDTIMADSNYWGGSLDPIGDGLIGGGSSVIATNPLPTDPNI